MSLLHLQNHFQNIIYHESNEISMFANESSPERIQVYRNNYFGNLQKTLSSIYPVCKKLVGDECFEMLSFDYINQHPSVYRNLNEYGENFSSFILSNAILDQVPYLSDIANLEWYWHKIFNGINNPFIEISHIQKAIVDFGDDIVFVTPNNATIIRSVFPLIQIWEICQPEYEGDFKIDLNMQDEKYFILWQEDYMIRMVELSMDEKSFLDLIIKKIPFYEVCKEFNHHNKTVILLDCIKKGLIRI